MDWGTRYSYTISLFRMIWLVVLLPSMMFSNKYGLNDLDTKINAMLKGGLTGQTPGNLDFQAARFTR